MPGFNLNEYVTVAERIEEFYKKYPEGSLQAEIIDITDKKVVMKGFAFRQPNDPNPGIGHAEEIREASMVNKTSAVENAESSAWGRALAALGFHVKKGIASREEMHKVQRTEKALEGTKKGGSAAPPTAPPDPVPSYVPQPNGEAKRSEKDLCPNCGTERDAAMRSWLALKKRRDPNFPDVCPKCHQKRAAGPGGTSPITHTEILPEQTQQHEPE